MIRSISIAILRAVVTVLLTVTFTFIVLRVSGDPVLALLPLESSVEVIERTRAEWGLDRPLPLQFVSYIGNLLHGDFGRSLNDGRDALIVVLEKVPATLMLMATSFVIAVIVGTLFGLLAAVWRGHAIDRAIMAFAVLVHSMPSFLLAILLVLLLAVSLGLLPSGGGQTLRHLVLPTCVIGFSAAGVIARFVRSSTLEVLSQSYIQVARIKPLPKWYFVMFHVLPNASLPLLTVLGFLLGGMIGGAAVVESVFAWPGVGRFLVFAVARRDLAVVQTIVILISIMMVIANLLTDILYSVADPRLRGKSSL
jgi:peptide/nickel transport system permease protein